MSQEAAKAKPAVVVALARYSKVPAFAAATGYTEESIYTKIKRGVWLEDHEFIRAPDGNVLIDMHGYEKWATGGRTGG